MGSSKSSLQVTPSQTRTSLSSRADLLVQLHSSNVSWRQCNSGCICHCHKRAFFALAEPWRQTFGCLSIGYVGSSMLSQACTVNGCRSRERSSFTLNYLFPSWFLARGIHVSLRAGRALSLDMKIRLPHVRHSSKIFRYIDTLNVRGVQRLLSKREASPWDIDEDGWSLLRVSLHCLILCRLRNSDAMAFILKHCESSISRSFLSELYRHFNIFVRYLIQAKN